MTKRIIIYDDDKDILNITSAILEMKGYEVLCREHCRDLKDDLEGFRPKVILMDNWLPDIGGVKAIQFIKSQDAFRNMHVIFFSANNNMEELAKEAGADELLRKPFDIAELEQLVDKAMKE